MKLMYLVPKNLLSLILGFLAHIHWPPPINNWLIRTFAKAYNIQLAESEFPIEDYKSLGEFFVRKLKPEVRPLASDWCVNPADSKWTELGRVTTGQILTAKGQKYTLTELLGDSSAYEKYANGQNMTYYLCPADYHRVHSPVSGGIVQITHIPGQLWPVNDWAVTNIKNLFAINERVIVEIKTDRGSVAVVFVGATNVGSIEIFKEKKVRTNVLFASSRPQIFKYEKPLVIEKGEELGLFRMGSTVVVIYPTVVTGNIAVPKQVKVRSALN